MHQAERPSRTAEVMALFRALESVRPARERLFFDPFATLFLRSWGRLLVALARVPALSGLVCTIIDRQWPGARTSAIARTRLIDDAMSAALDAGSSQVLLLGAGFDCRAHRLAAMNGVRIFEVDRAATQLEKIRRLERDGRSPVRDVHYVPMDFLREALDSTLLSGGFHASVRTFVLWEGVTNYLSNGAVDATFRAIGALAGAGSRILFTYVHAGVLDGSVRFEGGAEILKSVRDAGEPWTFGFHPQDLPAYLAARGFTVIEDLSADEYRSRYFGDAARRMAGYSFYRAALCVRS